MGINILGDSKVKIPELEYQILDASSLIEYAKKKLPLTGTLKCHDLTSYCYLDIDDDFILKLFPFIQELNQNEKIQMPNYFSSEKNNIGAHISIVYQDEPNADKIKNDIQNQKIPDTISFNILELIKAPTINKILFALTISSPDIERLRTHYDLSSYLNYKGLFLVPFHISIALIEKHSL